MRTSYRVSSRFVRLRLSWVGTVACVACVVCVVCSGCGARSARPLASSPVPTSPKAFSLSPAANGANLGEVCDDGLAASLPHLPNGDSPAARTMRFQRARELLAEASLIGEEYATLLRVIERLKASDAALTAEDDALRAVVSEVLEACHGIEQAAGKDCRESREVTDFAQLLPSSSANERARIGAVSQTPTSVAAKLRLRLVVDALTARGKHLREQEGVVAEGYGVMEKLEAWALKCPPRRPDLLVVRADPRALTVVVFAAPSKSLQKELRRFAGDGTDELSNQVRRGAEGGFGSGFVVVQKSKGGVRKFVVTNHHVIAQADDIHVEHEGKSFATRVVFDDPLYDLAVLETPDLPQQAGFALATTQIHDREEVVATGYPGIGGRPSYQTTRGFVSNERYVDPADESNRMYLQHTAPIDPGSSGGPITNVRGEVVGVNTMKIVGRENVAIAVPTAAVVAAISAARGSARILRKDDALRTACLGFVDAVLSKDPAGRLALQLAPELVAREGVESFRGAALQQPMLLATLRASPIATLTYSVAARIAQDLESEGVVSSFETCPQLPSLRELEVTDAAPVTFQTLLKKRVVTFAWNGASYTIVQYPMPARTAAGPSAEAPAAPAKPATNAKKPVPNNRIVNPSKAGRGGKK